MLFWHTDCSQRNKPKKYRAPSLKGKPVVRLGRKATDQFEDLKAGLPNRCVVDLQGVGFEGEELRSNALPVFGGYLPHFCAGWFP
jgi:hypothetical protein